MDKKVAIVVEMVENGYCLFDESVEHFASRFDEATLLIFLSAFKSKKEQA